MFTYLDDVLSLINSKFSDCVNHIYAIYSFTVNGKQLEANKAVNRLWNSIVINKTSWCSSPRPDLLNCGKH